MRMPKQKSPKIIAVIPARAGSRGIPCKNIVNLAGKALVAYTIEAAKQSKIFDKIVVSTDSERIESISVKYGAQVVKRPKRLARDRAPTEPAMLHVLEKLKKKDDYEPDIVFLLQPTSPLRADENIKAAYKKFVKEKLDSLLSVARNTTFIWKEEKNRFKPLNYNHLHRPRRQEIKGQFRENGAIYITKYKILMKYRNRLGGRIGYYVMSDEGSFEIDSALDLLIAEHILLRHGRTST